MAPLVIAKRITLLLIVYSLSRLLFLYWNSPLFHDDSVQDIFLSFVHGLRFDLSAILFTNALCLLIWMLPPRWLSRPLIARADLIFFAIVNFVALGMNFIDVEFVRFIGKRMSFEYFFLHQDVGQQASGILLTYWALFLMLFLLTGALIWSYPKIPATSKSEKWIPGTVWRLALIALIALIILGMRGGLTFKPIHPMDAYFLPRQELGLLTLNTPFNIIKSRSDGEIVTQRFYATDEEAIERVKKLTAPSRPPLDVAKGFNVRLFFSRVSPSRMLAQRTIIPALRPSSMN
jgi:hypothetical protein